MSPDATRCHHDILSTVYLVLILFKRVGKPIFFLYGPLYLSDTKEMNISFIVNELYHKFTTNLTNHIYIKSLLIYFAIFSVTFFFHEFIRNFSTYVNH